ncbi:MAG: SH3 domain-containing protein [Pseudomonadota bacterium]
MQLARSSTGVAAMLAIALAGSVALALEGDALLVTGSNVNVRAGPSTDAGILARVGIDEPATELRRVGDWVEVTLPRQDVLGWIHGSLLATAPTPTPAPTGTPAANSQPQPPAAAGATPTEVAATATPASTQPAAPASDAEAAPSPPVTTAAVPSGAVPSSAGTSASVPDGEPAPDTPLGRFREEVEHFNSRAVAAAGVDLFTGVEPLGEGAVQVVTTDAWAIMSQPGQQSYLNALYGRWQAVSDGAGDLRLEIVDSTGALMMERSGP